MSPLSAPLSPLSNDPPLAISHDLAGLGIYVHFPWCLKKCPYCDFLSIAVRSPETGRSATRAEAQQSLPHSKYADAVISELDRRVAYLRTQQENAESCALPPVKSIFFGGGTPSLWAPHELGRIIRHVRQLFLTSDLDRENPELEVTVECNPSSVDQAHFEALLEQGVNRISVGVQALHEQRLQFLGRLHGPDQALDAVRAALRAKIPRVSADLIYGVFKQSPAAAVEEVKRVADLGVHHMSAYMLTVEENTRFGALNAQGKLPLLDDALVARSFEAVSTTMASLGFEHYEVSNFARLGARSVHNTGYWLGRDYLGVGTGAYGTVTLAKQRLRYRNFISPERYMTAWLAQSSDLDPFNSLSVEQETIDGETAVDEAILLGLRLVDGINIQEVARVRGATKARPERDTAIARLCQSGKLLQDGNQLRIPRPYWLFADQIIRELL